MAQKNGLILVGIRHRDADLEAILKLVGSYSGKVKSLGLEGITPSKEKIFSLDGNAKKSPLQEEIMILTAQVAGVNPFWATIAARAAMKGMRIVSIDSKYALDKSRRYENVFNDKTKSDKIRIENLNKKMVLRAILSDNFMVKRIKKFEPEMVIAGSGHIKPIRKAVLVKELIFLSKPQVPLRFRAHLGALRMHYKIKKTARKLRRKI